ncbi:hypothetical protein ACTHPH_19400 [Paenibacillus pasadenensis]|uniref:Uncharacterized protein n=1 Tax=Paenibacillus pasadenensis TaxID=217090 RepID=A0A2N5N2W6_9BACL|nr:MULTISPECIES: hypothetical protein [Paenibacillus]PLT44670.1 hypothetical protein B8V81_3101 [Paenibacillus pasadenensis]QGG55147.1 hypothetical protein GE073_05835 [Paenibacillus sp. B01]
MTDRRLLFRFHDAESASVAAATLLELGYDAAAQGAQEVGLSLRGSDLTSALEIAFAHGGELDVQEQDVIPIPAHLVNEDLVAWEEGFGYDGASTGISTGASDGSDLRNRDEATEGESAFPEQEGSLSYFSGDVHG